MSRAIGPRPPFAAGNAALAWVLIAAAWGLIALAWLAWAAARLAALAAGRGHVPAFGTRWASALVHGRTAQAWPGTPTPLVAVTGGILAVLLAGVTAIAWRLIARSMTKPGDPVAALSRDRSIRQLAQSQAAEQGIRLRPSLTGARPGSLAPADIGLVLGRLKQPGGNGPDLYASWEDTVLAFMGPRSGKTTSLGIPYVLSAPGAVIATSNKADLWAATAELRAAPGSRVWVFDPQRITAAGQRWWWNPLAGLTSVEAAHRLASHFVLTIDDESKRDIWGPAAQELLTSLLLAAAASRRTLRDVSRWLDDPGSPTPADLLDDAGYRALGSALRGAQHGAPETRDGIYQTARTAAKCLHDEEIMAWVTPPRGRRLPAFDPYRFPVTRDTLYLLTESRSAAAPLIAGLTDTTMRAGRRRAEQAGGRLDPPVVAMLDEAANICRIADLPDQYSHLGSRGMVPVTILQSYEQGEMVWGAKGMAALWGAATRKLIGASVHSPRLARDVALLVGHHDVPVRSISVGDGRASEQISFQRRLILEAADIAAIERGTALLLSAGTRPALLDLRPWYASPDAPRIDAARLRAEAAIQHAAQAADASPARILRRGSPGRTPQPGGVMTADPAALSAVDEDDLPEPLYASVQDWVSEHFLPMYRRPLGGEFRWCPQWWRHAEAITRLTALWQSWEAMRLQPGTGTASWLRDYLDHQLPVLLGRGGPFAQCSEDEHIEPPHRRSRPAAPRLVGHRQRRSRPDGDEAGIHLPLRPAPPAGARRLRTPRTDGAAGEQP